MKGLPRLITLGDNGCDKRSDWRLRGVCKTVRRAGSVKPGEPVRLRFRDDYGLTDEEVAVVLSVEYPGIAEDPDALAIVTFASVAYIWRLRRARNGGAE